MRPEVWAPAAERVRAVVDGQQFPLHREADGWWSLDRELSPGSRYGYLLDDAATPLPDPRSERLPDGVHGLTQVYDHQAHRWQDGSWAGRELAGAVIYELHVGTFTLGATLDSAVERLDHLVELGITHVELLPVNAVNGIWNWGYDGVAWYAVHEPYGGPDALKRFVDACHRSGIAVLLDVVYNHLGASGNYLPEFGPYLKTGRNTWGDLVNLDGPGSEQVRRYIIDNALRWLRDFHLDGLRLDAVHALQDSSPTHLLQQLAAEVADLSAQLGRPLPLIAESDLNDPTLISPTERGGYGLDAQWDDDVHHVWHAMLSGEKHGYYADFGDFASLAKVLTRAFYHDGTFSSFRGRPHGKPVDVAHTPGWKFVVFLQDHDQVGNRATGDRLSELLSPQLLKVAAVLLLTSPFTPMLWMGEEWAAGTRWPFFSSHPEPELARAVSEGRIAEFADHGWDVDSMIDPQDPAAYQGAVLNWSEKLGGQHAEILDLYRRLIALRAANPDLADPRLDRVRVDFDEQQRTVTIGRGSFRVLVNLDERPHAVAVPAAAELVLSTAEHAAGPPERVAGGSLELPARSAAIVRTAEV
jgi:maltooligosyltrehalose trehalohydrolase